MPAQEAALSRAQDSARSYLPTIRWEIRSDRTLGELEGALQAAIGSPAWYRAPECPLTGEFSHGHLVAWRSSSVDLFGPVAFLGSCSALEGGSAVRGRVALHQLFLLFPFTALVFATASGDAIWLAPLPLIFGAALAIYEGYQLKAELRRLLSVHLGHGS